MSRKASLSQAEKDALAELRDLLAPETKPSIAALAKLRDTAPRCATQERAASKLLVMYYNTVTLPARLDAGGDADDTEANVTVVINQSDVDTATARAMALRAQRLAEAKQSS